MFKNILFLICSLGLIVLLWWLYQYIGDYIFLIGLIALFVLLIGDAKTRFGKKQKNKKPPFV